MENMSDNAGSKKISVAWAAKRMRCSERTVLNRIEDKAIIAEKPGRDWEIDSDSVRAYCIRCGVAPLPEDLKDEAPHEDVVLESQVPAVLHESVAVLHAPASASVSSGVAAPALQPPPVGSLPTIAASPSSTAGFTKKKTSSITVTAAFRLFHQANTLLEPSLKLFDQTDDRFHHRIKALQLEAIESLGAGFYSYGPDKIESYNRARSIIGAIAALIYSHSAAGDEMRVYLATLESDVIPAIRSLILYIKKPNDKRPKKETSLEI